jgi:hypothetical protein
LPRPGKVEERPEEWEEQGCERDINHELCIYTCQVSGRNYIVLGQRDVQVEWRLREYPAIAPSSSMIEHVPASLSDIWLEREWVWTKRVTHASSYPRY